MARTVGAALFVSVDGVAQDPHTFMFDNFDERMGELMDAATGPATDAIMGRRTYEEWSRYWPAMGEEDFGAFINPVRKHVASTTLRAEDVTWENARLVDGDLHEFVRGLRGGDASEGDVVVVGSVSTVRELFLAGLVDELTIMTIPTVAGTGRRLFEGVTDTTRLRALRSEMTPNGNVVTTYALRAV